MKLTEINQENLTDEAIDKIVYSEIEDNGQSSKYGICFGNSMLLNKRVKKAVECYHKKRIKKIIFTGGTGGISNEEKDQVPEAQKMKELAIKLGVPEEEF